MPIPEDHLQRLEENLLAQERWLRTLRQHIASLQDEVSAYEMILALGRDQDCCGYWRISATGPSGSRRPPATCERFSRCGAYASPTTRP
jgi:hypothetical protein